MKDCNYKIFLIDFLNRELPEIKRREVEAHLTGCRSCREKIEEFHTVNDGLKYRARPLPREDLLNRYHQELDKKYATESIAEKIRQKAVNFINEFIVHPSPGLRLAEIVSFVFAGILLGWIFFYPQQNANIVYTRYEPPQMILPIYGSDLKFLNNFLFESEMILLDLVNTAGDNIQNEEIMNMKKDLAQKLLIETFAIHDIALQKNESQILAFLTKMELILYEISNLNFEESETTIAAIKQIINDTKLISEVKTLQALIENSTSKTTI